jgi:transcriptional regulator GlxA family with amidase domain
MKNSEKHTVNNTTEIRSILFLAFPDVSEQDLLAAWELMRSLAWTLSYSGQQLEVTLGSFEQGPIKTHMGASLGIQKVITATDRYDLLYIPGGIGSGAASKDSRVLQLIQAHHAEGRWVAANCAGVGILHRAGVLEGLEVSAPATLARRLPQLGTTVTSPRLAWKIDAEHKIFTSGGAGTVHPGTIALVWQLFGEEAARNLSAAWDSLPLHGNTLFAAEGPVMNDDAERVAVIQDQFEMMFLPE